MTDFEVENRHYGVSIDLRPYNGEYSNHDIYLAAFADVSSMPQIVKKNGSGGATYYRKYGGFWHSEALTCSSHKLSEHSAEHEALELLSKLHKERLQF